jgi:hypothetical protein
MHCNQGNSSLTNSSSSCSDNSPSAHPDRPKEPEICLTSTDRPVTRVTTGHLGPTTRDGGQNQASTAGYGKRLGGPFSERRSGHNVAAISSTHGVLSRVIPESSRQSPEPSRNDEQYT